ncbi:MAG TPA: GNAT family N-acetyltransferase [Methanomicrobiales archaeon]|nr:GNAT family N-acetyltransferase [Methanomicrobiales archaeon]
MKSPEVRALEKDEYSAWDALAARSPQGTIYQSVDWLTFCSRELGLDLSLFGAYREKELRAGIPLFIHRKSGLVGIGDSVCYLTPYTGLLLDPGPSRGGRGETAMAGYRGIVDAFCGALEGAPLGSVTVTNSPAIQDIRPFLWRGWREAVRYTHIFDLAGDIDRALDRRVRSVLSHSTAREITVGESADTDTFSRLSSATFGRKGIRVPVPERAWREMVALLKRRGSGTMFEARLPGGEVSNMSIVLWDSRRAYILAAASDPDFLGMNGMTVLDYHVLAEMKKRGFPEIDLMMANLPELASYAGKFNPRLVPFYTVSWEGTVVRLARALGSGR